MHMHGSTITMTGAEFDALVAKHYQDGRTDGRDDERDRCAKIAEVCLQSYDTMDDIPSLIRNGNEVPFGSANLENCTKSERGAEKAAK